MTTPAYIRYRNHRGEVSWRRITPLGIVHGLSQWHPGEQWLLQAWDEDKQAQRTFALADVLEWRNEPPCPDCNGRGTGDDWICIKCNGTGRTNDAK